MRRLLAIVGVSVVVVLVGWLAWTQVSDGGGGQPGSAPAVDRINSETDCAALQGEFDTAERNRHTDYMQVADRRMRSLGCY